MAEVYGLAVCPFWQRPGDGKRIGRRGRPGYGGWCAAQQTTSARTARRQAGRPALTGTSREWLLCQAAVNDSRPGWARRDLPSVPRARR